MGLTRQRGDCNQAVRRVLDFAAEERTEVDRGRVVAGEEDEACAPNSA
jgi:hypothetical protein